MADYPITICLKVQTWLADILRRMTVEEKRTSVGQMVRVLLEEAIEARRK